MIRKVPNIKAWILKPDDYLLLLKVNSQIINAYNIIRIFNLPLLSCNPDDGKSYTDYTDFVMVTIENPFLESDLFNPDGTFKLKYVEEINKTWNKFYD